MRRPVVLALLIGLASSAWAESRPLPEVEVWKNPSCGCCAGWAAHLREAGFRVQGYEVVDVAAPRAALGMPASYASCHVGRVGAYAVEGHVPAADLKRLLDEKPRAVGLAVPGMPMGAPGMEGPHPTAYTSLLVGGDGSASAYVQH